MLAVSILLFSSHISNDLASFSFIECLEIMDRPSDFLLQGDKCRDEKLATDQANTSDKQEEVFNNYRSLDKKSKKVFSALEGAVHITVRRDDIVTDLLCGYHDKELTRSHVTIVGEDASGKGVGREMYALFWDKLLLIRGRRR